MLLHNALKLLIPSIVALHQSEAADVKVKRLSSVNRKLPPQNKSEKKKTEKFSEDEEDEEFFCPAERYIPFFELESKVDVDYILAAETKLGYDGVSWDSFTNVVEDADWESLVDLELDEGAEMLGYEEDSWDCCLNHYKDYSWEELRDDVQFFPHLELAYKILGWSEETWETNAEIPSEDKDWSELIAFEQAAADYLCFDEYAWNDMSLPWPSDEVDETPPSAMDFSCPEVRYQDFATLETNQHYAAIDLGYNTFSWNSYQNPIEELTFEEIINERDWRDAMFELGYEEETWDCCMNNYAGYEYSELDDDEFPMLKLAVQVLGWNEKTWDSVREKDAPPSEYKEWDELTDLEKAAADYLCYYEESWNEEETVSEEISDMTLEEEAYEDESTGEYSYGEETYAEEINEEWEEEVAGDYYYYYEEDEN